MGWKRAILVKRRPYNSRAVDQVDRGSDDRGSLYSGERRCPNVDARCVPQRRSEGDTFVSVASRNARLAKHLRARTEGGATLERRMLTDRHICGGREQ